MKMRPITPLRWSMPGRAAHEDPRAVELLEHDERAHQRQQDADERDDRARRRCASARNGMCETIHSQPTGIGPQNSRLTNVISGEDAGGEHRVAAPRGARCRASAARRSAPASCRAGGRRRGRRCLSDPSARLNRVRARATARAAAALADQPLVQRVEALGVLLVDDVALDLQRRRQLAGLLREVVVEDEEPLDLLDLRVLLVGAVELGLDQRDAPAGAPRARRARCPRCPGPAPTAPSPPRRA